MAGRQGGSHQPFAGQIGARSVGACPSGRSSRVHALGRVHSRRTVRRFHPQGFFHQVKGIADTGFLVAFARSGDMHHRWTVSVAEQVSEPLLTCEAVLAETAFQPAKRGGGAGHDRGQPREAGFRLQRSPPAPDCACPPLCGSSTRPGRPLSDSHERIASAAQRHHGGSCGFSLLSPE